MSILNTSSNQNTQFLFEDTIQSYTVLHDFYWKKLIHQKKDYGWRQSAYQLYFTMKSTSPLLLFAANHIKHEPLFSQWARTHAEEEKDHYLWYRDDLKNLGFSSSDLDNVIPDEIILEFLGKQFALVATSHPVSILGYFYAMECFPSNPSAIRNLAENLSIPSESLKTIIYHTDVDQDHKQEINKLVTYYSNDPYLINLMLYSGISVLLGWTKFFNKLINECE